MRRWTTIKEFVTSDQERLQHITIYPEDSDKVNVKAENKGFNYTRLLLVPKKEQRNLRYNIAKISRV